jgi:hypothetical protein
MPRLVRVRSFHLLLAESLGADGSHSAGFFWWNLHWCRCLGRFLGILCAALIECWGGSTTGCRRFLV